MKTSPARVGVIGLTALFVFLPLGLIFYQSLLDAPFFMPHKLGAGAFEFIFADSDFWDSLRNSLVIATAMAVIAVPLGGILAFLMIRTDLPGRGWIEPLLLIPVFVSPMVLGFGYVVSAGPVGFYSVWAKELLGFVPWNVYSLTGIAIIRKARMPPSGTAISAIAPAITSEFLSASQKSLSSKMNWKAPMPALCGMKNGASRKL